MTRKNEKRRKKQKQDSRIGRDAAIRQVTRQVENPDWRPDREGERAFPRQTVALVNVKESAIETLFARNFLGSAQKQAADRFRALYEAAGGTMSGIDYAMDRVDGGRGDPVAGKLIAAHELRRCRDLLGQRGFDNVQAVCGEGRALTELTPHKRERLTMADNLRADLDDLSTMWGLQTKRKMAS